MQNLFSTNASSKLLVIQKNLFLVGNNSVVTMEVLEDWFRIYIGFSLNLKRKQENTHLHKNILVCNDEAKEMYYADLLERKRLDEK